MSDSAREGDAARLEAALERIVSALGRATQPPATPPDLTTPDLTTPDPVAPHDAAVPPQAPPGSDGIDVAQITARLDDLIAELRGVLGEDDEPPGDMRAQS